MTRDTFTWPRTGFEFGQQYEFTKPLKHQKLQKIFQTDRSFELFYVQSRQICFVSKDELCF